jgi:hypothetical protein
MKLQKKNRKVFSRGVRYKNKRWKVKPSVICGYSDSSLIGGDELSKRWDYIRVDGTKHIVTAPYALPVGPPVADSTNLLFSDAFKFRMAGCYINDASGSYTPDRNASFNVRDGNIFALSNIREGEEILLSYDETKVGQHGYWASASEGYLQHQTLPFFDEPAEIVFSGPEVEKVVGPIDTRSKFGKKMVQKRSAWKRHKKS